MAEVTVTELAKTVGASVDRLLMQMKEAGLPHDSADAAVSDEEKQTLLAYLKGLHGETSGEPKKRNIGNFFNTSKALFDQDNGNIFVNIQCFH